MVMGTVFGTWYVLPGWLLPWVDVLTLLALIGTLVYLIRYTHATIELRKQAELQNRLAIRPFVVIEFDRDCSEHSAVDPPRIHNLGPGPAVDIIIPTIHHAGHDENRTPVEWEIEMSARNVLASGESADVQFLVSRNGQSGGLARQTSILLSALASPSNTDSPKESTVVPVKILFKSTRDEQYMTTMEMLYSIWKRRSWTRFVSLEGLTAKG